MKSVEITKAVELYETMARRCAEGGFEPNQARVYGELAEFTGQFDTIEQATAGIKQSEFYLAPTEALVRDKISALLLAAEKNDMPDVAEVYRKKLSAIDVDQSEMYVSGYETEAQNLRSAYLLTAQAFAEIFRAYVCYACDGNASYLGEIKNNLSKLTKPSSDFRALSELQSFRELTTCTESGYKTFVDDICAFVQGDELTTVRKAEDVASDSCDEDWAEVSEAKNEILARGQEVQRFNDRETEIATAPTVEEYELAFLKGEKATYTFEEVV